MMRLRGWRTRTTDFKGLWTIWRPRPASTGCLDGPRRGVFQRMACHLRQAQVWGELSTGSALYMIRTRELASWWRRRSRLV